MGQYWICVNLDKKEFIDPHKLSCGLKLWEQLANHPSTGTALIILCAAMPDPRGGGDFDISKNWHGPERNMKVHNICPGPMPINYPRVACRTIGRWAGDRIAFVGDYAEDTDLSAEFEASKIYERCRSEKETILNDDSEGADYMQNGKYVHFVEVKPPEYTDVTDDVCAVIEHELNGKFTGTGWRDFEYNHDKKGQSL